MRAIIAGRWPESAYVWSIGQLIDAALTAVPPKPTPTAPDRRRQFGVIQGGRS
jgi:hypothetical protein